MSDTFSLLLCDERGQVSGAWLEQHNRMRVAARFEPTEEPFACTGSACYVFGQFITCTNPLHSARTSQPGRALMRADATHVAVLANEVFEIIRDEPKDDPNIVSLRESLEACKRVSEWLYSSRWYTANELLRPQGISCA